MSLCRVEAIVLRARDLGEADKILTLFTRELGKVSAVAKGVRKIKSKNRGAVQPFSRTSIMLYQGRNLDTVTQCQLLEGFPNLRNDLERLSYAAYFAQLVDLMLPEREKNEDVFLLLLTTFYLLSYAGFQDGSLELVARQFEIKLIALLGYQPQLEQCVFCERPLTASPLKFSGLLGGVLCPSCQGNDLGAQPISRGTIAIWKQLASMDVRKLHRLRLSLEEQNRLERILEAYISQILEQKPKTVDFLKSLKKIFR